MQHKAKSQILHCIFKTKDLELTAVFRLGWRDNVIFDFGTFSLKYHVYKHNIYTQCLDVVK